MPRSRLNLIGAGKLGRTLACLWREKFEVGAVVTRRQESASDAVAFIGAGIPATIDSIQSWPDAEYWLLAAPDDALANLADILAASGRKWIGTTVFHCSGSASSQLLEPLAEAGALTASAHPVHSFADPRHSLNTFSGAWCLIEGHREAADQLTRMFTTIGAQPLVTDQCDKALYHAATAMASNLLVALFHNAEAMLSSATGLTTQQSRQLLEPLGRHTLDNHFRTGASAALTGPIARGDTNTVARHLQALSHHNPDWAACYRALSRVAVDIATTQGQAGPEALQHIRDLLDDHQ